MSTTPPTKVEFRVLSAGDDVGWSDAVMAVWTGTSCADEFEVELHIHPVAQVQAVPQSESGSGFGPKPGYVLPCSEGGT